MRGPPRQRPLDLAEPVRRRRGLQQPLAALGDVDEPQRRGHGEGKPEPPPRVDAATQLTSIEPSFSVARTPLGGPTATDGSSGGSSAGQPRTRAC